MLSKSVKIPEKIIIDKALIGEIVSKLDAIEGTEDITFANLAAAQINGIIGLAIKRCATIKDNEECGYSNINNESNGKRSPISLSTSPSMSLNKENPLGIDVKKLKGSTKRRGYSLIELREICRANGIDHDGNKLDLINRILAFISQN